MKSRNNPYSNSGKIIDGDRFIGRQRSLRLIDGRVVNAKSPGNLAIVGEPRIGKSSLAFHGIMSHREELLDRRSLVVWLDVGLFKSGWEIFARLVIRVREVLYENKWLTPAMDRVCSSIAEAGELSEQSQSDILSFFSMVRSSDVLVLVILDEFDNARRLWAGDKSGFELLREISYNADCSVTLITTSRRTIAEIQKQSGVISTLSGTFLPDYLKPFDQSEMTEFFTKLEAAGVRLAKDDKQTLIDYTGGHPFFLDTIAFNLVEGLFAEEQINVSVACDIVATLFLDEYQRLVELMMEDGTINKLIQVLFGPLFDLRSADITRFLQYGIIKEQGDQYVGFSKHFQDYIQYLSRTIEVWPLWRETEQCIRRIVATYLCETYGTDWDRDLKKLRPKWAVMIDGWEASRERERKKYGSQASDNLLDYTYPAELFTVVNGDWKWFGRIFPNDAGHWKRPFELLAGVRTPLAHNRPVNEGMLKEVSGLCEQVVEYVRKWEATISKS